MARESPKEKVKTGSLWARVAAALERWWEVDLLECECILVEGSAS